MKVADPPTLFDPARPTPALSGTRCQDCDETSFPPLTIGCEVCGAPESRLQSVEFAAKGILHSVATVHAHAGRDIEAPFVVGEVQLQDGPLIRSVLTELSGLGDVEAIGRSVEGVWHSARVDDEGNEVVELRFALADTSPRATS